ncbi:MAG: carbonic anhydrase family protein [Luteolibacter sp.]
MKPSLLLAASISLVSFANAEEAAVQMPVTADEQKAMTPDSVLEDLMAGNQRFVAGETTPLNIKENIEITNKGQYPKAVILSCIDSRVPVENVFDQGIGDIFVGRVAGNVENVDMLGSFEFATKLAGSKVVMVLGHEACGAVKGACDHAELGNLTELLDKIQPAVDAVKGDFPEDQQNSKNIDFVNKVVEENVRITVADIRKNSPILAEMEKAGEIKIVGAMYSLKTGEVTMVD